MDQLLPRPSENDDNGIYDFSAPPQHALEDAETLLIHKIASSKAFKRLEDVRFLGALDYCLIPNPNGMPSNARYSRAQHSVGVAALARTYLHHTSHSMSDRLLCVASAMLHDIGHSPLSHTLEPVFVERFGANHHTATNDIILGKKLSEEIPVILRDFGISPSWVIDILEGDDNRFEGFFSGPINFDTIEGIMRSRSYLKMQSLGLTPTKIVIAATLRSGDFSKDVVDNFWKCKDEMYNLIIRSRLGVIFDTMFQEVARNIPCFSQDDFFLTESTLFKKYPVLRAATQKANWESIIQALPDQTPFQIRKFYVDEEGDFFRWEDKARYKQQKFASTLTLKGALPM